MFLTVRYLGIVVHSSSLREEQEYKIGRSKRNDIIIDISVMSRDAGKLSFKDGDWFFSAMTGGSLQPEVKLTPNEVISLKNQLELMITQDAPEESTKATAIDQFHVALKKSSRRFNYFATTVASVFFIGLAGGLGSYVYMESKKPLNALTVLPYVRSKIIEFEFPEQSKIKDDLKKYAELKDEDFSTSLGFCTGSLIAPNVIMTANHCMQGSGVADPTYRLTVKTHDRKEHKIKRMLGFDAKRDFAFLEMEGMESYGYLSFSDSFELGDKVFTIGNAHGEGIAIRDGILSSETPDSNDPSVKFIRYSAAASPGNSGGPLLDNYGRVVSLVFARGNAGENYNLGTTTKDLKDGFKRFVSDTSPKKVTIRLKDFLEAMPRFVLRKLELPSRDSWYESPEYQNPLSQIEFEVGVPQDIDGFFTESSDSAAKATKLVYDNIVKKMSDSGDDHSGWESWAQGDLKVIVPSQFDYLDPINVEKATQTVVKNGGFVDPPSFLLDASKAEIKKSIAENKYPFDAYVTDGRLVLKSDENPSKLSSDIAKGRFLFSSQSRDKESLLTMSFMGSMGGKFLEIQNKKPIEGSWAKHRRLTDDEFLNFITGAKGLSVDIANEYIRPNAQKPFTITKLDEDVKSSSVKDNLGRDWDVKQVHLLGENITAFCLPNISGPTCVIRIFKEDHPEIMRHALENYVNYTLSTKLLNPGFVSADATIDYYKSGLAQTNPMMSDFKVTKAPSGELDISLDKLGIDFKIPSDESPESLRLFGGYDGDLKSWIAMGFEFVGKRKSSKTPEICAMGIEPKSLKTNKFLNGERRAEKMAADIMAALKKPAKASKGKSLYTLIDAKSAKTGGDYSVYGYCFPVIAYALGQANDDIYEARLSELPVAYKPKFSIKKPQVVGH
jgi:S1-C subfamily serine protease